MSERQLGTAPNYVNAALTMLGVNLLWIFFVIWVLYGIVPVLLLALCINHLIDRLAERYGSDTPALPRD